MQHTLFKESDSANLIEQANTPNKTLPCLPEKAPERKRRQDTRRCAVCPHSLAACTVKRGSHSLPPLNSAVML